MRGLKILLLAVTFLVMFFAIPQIANGQQPATLSDVINKIVAQEQVEIQSLSQYSPLVETYIQQLRADKQFGTVPDGDRYFLGRAQLAKGVELEPLTPDTGTKHKFFAGWGDFFSAQFVPSGFLQMIYVDQYGFDRAHYNFEYVRREFLGDVRCLVFNVDPLPKAGKGRFVGRIWVEDQDYHIVRFNGAYGGASLISDYYNFDSWRTNAGKNQWLPAFIYAEEGNVQDARTTRIRFKAFRAQTRLWGYNLGHAREEQELNKVLVEAPVTDRTEAASDFSPFQAERSWDRQAEDNVVDRLERMGLMAPYGDVDKLLETVVNNLEVTNGLDIQPEVRCRVLMTSTLESFAMGHTIVLSRALIDVLPDEASLAAILAHELGHVVLGHRMDTQFAFLNHMRFDEKQTFQHFAFARTPEEELAANQKARELMKNSPYGASAGTAQLFLRALQKRSKEIPNLISPHLGDRVTTSWTMLATVFSSETAVSKSTPASVSEAEAEAPVAAKTQANVIVALPLGGRIKVDPWDDRLRILKSAPVGMLAEAEKRPFEITPFMLYLTRSGEKARTETPGAAWAKSDTETQP